MNIIVITMRLTNRNLNQFYNVQDFGLCKALSKLGHHVKLYNFVNSDADEVVYFSELLEVHYLRAKAWGGHTVHSFDFITGQADAVVAYCDNQLYYKRIVQRCNHAKVLLLPYVGVIGSHHRYPFVRFALDMLIRNKSMFRTQTVLAKTPNVAKELAEAQVKDVIVAPACLDLDLVKSDYALYDKTDLAGTLSLPKDRDIILYIGRMIEEKRPLEMIDIFEKIVSNQPKAFLVMIGKGILQNEVKAAIQKKDLVGKCVMIEQIDNDQIWQYYTVAKAYVNLNQVEIFGMAMLEAMYYECPVVARRAPGPEYIFTDGVDGYLCDNSDSIAERVIEILHARPESVIEAAKKRITSDFVWESTARTIESVIISRKA